MSDNNISSITASLGIESYTVRVYGILIDSSKRVLLSDEFIFAFVGVFTNKEFGAPT